VKTRVILNPFARTAENSDDLLAKFERLQPDKICVTSEVGDAKNFAREATLAGCDTIVAAGGDGTLNEIINGIADRLSDICIGIVPLGTGNDFARSLELPNNMDDCIELIAKGCTKSFDLGRARGKQVRYFINVSTGGFSGIVDEKLTPEIKQTWGQLAYFRSAAAALPDLCAYETTIVFDDAETLSMRLYNVIISNGRYVAGGIPVAPEAVLDDGLLDVILIPEKPKTELAVLTGQILLGKHLSSQAIIYRRSAKVVVNSHPGMSFNVDGELLENGPSVFEVLPRGIQFLVSAK